MLEKVESFIQEAREGVPAVASSLYATNNINNNNNRGSPSIDQAPLELEVLYDDSWLDEMACALFFLAALVLMTLPYTEVC